MDGTLPLVPSLCLGPRPKLPKVVLKLALADRARRLIESFVDDGTWLYFIRCGRFVKIGFSKNPEERLRDMRTYTPFEVILVGSVPGCRDAERALHAMLHRQHHRLEWFRSTPAVEAMIASLISNPPCPRKVEPEKRYSVRLPITHSEYRQVLENRVQRSNEPR